MKKNYTKLTQEEKLNVIKDYQFCLLSVSFILEKYDISEGYFYNILRANNVETIGHKRYSYNVNESFFDRIDSEQKAYILGLLFADGCNDVKKRGGATVSLSLNEKDKDIIHQIKDILDFSGPAIERLDKRYNTTQIGLSINSKLLSDSLCKCGMVPAKSTILKFPDESVLPEQLFWHFVRGYFDGDGCIGIYCRGSRKNRPYSHVSICGSIPFISQLSVLFEEKSIKHRLEKKVKYSVLVINNEESRNLFMESIYQEASIFLKRKRDKWNQFQDMIDE